jgi:hypothetical protein
MLKANSNIYRYSGKGKVHFSPGFEYENRMVFKLTFGKKKRGNRQDGTPIPEYNFY